MVLELLMLLMALATPPQAPKLRLAPAPLLALAAPTAYQPHDRAVGNWRYESALGLDLPMRDALRQLAGTATTQTPRCVKLNNYWCIKRAGWAGEIASDPDGHVAFASAEEGAAVAALLLRRYYIDFKRHTAREIASRWAPPQCGGTVAAPGYARVSRVLARAANVARMLPQRPIPMGAAPARPKIADLAPHGIFNTVRARWLATHLPGGQPIMAFHGAPAPREAGLEGGAPLAACAGDATRINNYAVHIAEGAAAGPDADLRLFSADGQPTGNLARVMTNMAAVEIGPLRAHPSLVAYAVAQLRAEPEP